RLAKAEDVHIEIKNLVVVLDAHREVANARKTPLDAGRVKSMCGNRNLLAARIGHAIVAVKKTPLSCRISELGENSFSRASILLMSSTVMPKWLMPNSSVSSRRLSIEIL